MNMKNFKAVMAAIVMTTSLQAQIFTAKPGETAITFYSEAPLENIEAVNKAAAIVLKNTTNEIQISMNMNNFKFKNSLMEEHFNENYIESEKYPKCTFKGKINEPVDFSKDGETKVTVTGLMELHGVCREVTMNGTIKKAGDNLHLYSNFPVKVADYNIQVPSMYVKNIAETVDVTFKTVLEPYKKK
jgi:polyisoprenoid-binding protein YceI